MDYPVPHKECMVGFAMQDEGYGVPETVAQVVFMLPEGADLPQWQSNIEFFQMNAQNYEITHYHSAGEWLTGSINIPWCPAMMVLTTYYINEWAFTRDAANYYDGYWATFFVYLGQGLYLRFPDVKCTGGRFNVSFGSMAWLEFDINGIGDIVAGEAADFADITRLVANPYNYGETTISLGFPTLAQDNYTKDHTIEWSNEVLAPGDAGTLAASSTPVLLPNTAKPQWSGRFDQIFHNTSIWDAFRAKTECQLRTVVTRAGVATGTLTLPRILYTDPGLTIPADGVVQHAAAYQALGGTAGEASFTFTETV
ncbi:MAG TPA: hypothetical protein VMW58_13085 [Anaerolineae bacterium]|nr:hypothetical protein [Anaerolineae bacterium]